MPEPDAGPLRILNIEPLGYSEEARRIYRGLGRLDERPVGRTELLSIVDQYDVMLVRLAHQIDKEVLDRAHSLRVIVTPTTGLDHIDLDAAAVAGIEVLSLRDQDEFLKEIRATAEHTWALLLSLTRRIPWAHQHVLEGGWDRDEFRGIDLSGRRLGLLGLGRIGEMVAIYAQSFGMGVSAYDPYRDGWVDGVDRAPSLTDLAEVSEVLSIHIHSTRETRGLVGRDLLSRLPPQALVINTSRGDVVVEEDLVRMLDEGHVGGAAVDVIVGERSGEDSPLVEYAQRNANLIVTPHVGGATADAMERTEVHMARLLAEFLGQSGS